MAHLIFWSQPLDQRSTRTEIRTEIEKISCILQPKSFIRFRFYNRKKLKTVLITVLLGPLLIVEDGDLPIEFVAIVVATNCCKKFIGHMTDADRDFKNGACQLCFGLLSNFGT